MIRRALGWSAEDRDVVALAYAPVAAARQFGRDQGFPPQGITGTVEMLLAGAPSISLRLIAR